MAQHTEFVMSDDVKMEIWYDRSDKCWSAQYVNRKTNELIGTPWWGATRDYVLVFSPNVSDA